MAKLDEVFEAVHKERMRQLELYGASYKFEPQIVVYMTHDFYYDCMGEIQGGVSNDVYEFSKNESLLGFPCYRVADKSHLPWRVLSTLPSVQ